MVEEDGNIIINEEFMADLEERHLQRVQLAQEANFR